MKTGGYVYILTNVKHTVLYIGVTNNLPRRIQEHKEGLNKGFAYRYCLDKLVYSEYFEDITWAIAREKAMKKWNRGWKIELIERDNPNWQELSPL